MTDPEHKILAKALTDEFVSVFLPAAARMTNERSVVFVTTGGDPTQIRITIDDQGYRWQIADRHHGHTLPIDTPVPDVTELVAICFAKWCADVPVLDIAVRSVEEQNRPQQSRRVKGDAA